MGMHEPYTDREDDFIRTNWQLMTDREIAETLARTETGITSRRGKLRLLRGGPRPKDGSMRPWSLEDDEMLRQLFAADQSDEDIAIALGRTIQAVGQRRSSLGLLRNPRREERAGHWTDEEDQVLSWMFRKGWSDQQIGSAMEKTACAIKDRRQTLGLWRAPRQ
jgi:hypothetical protein